ncbi:hypothetical protein BABINDRAFT_8082 [Babjeviella inositovora NRRL Y-12698]|uniref:Mitochondrial group I intron splicing factor CCM1 n=1 Tax=Babjeviella inositovora NRRL Y-12698 TaxID=984486 RepID=A0A1E3QQF3_9ASCO|nr:uncharacterized protein BABINDRAFT_8082 [Babjeviella inositovora NRRL Y-12698]ODQ79890.1 hypothetical protein BABINDRAFT_8082 [Babjeviella inositovora NRRL Y-12698]
MSSRRILTQLPRQSLRVWTVPCPASFCGTRAVVFTGSRYRAAAPNHARMEVRGYSILSNTIAKLRKKKAVVEDKHVNNEHNVVVQNTGDEPLPAAVTDEIIVLLSEMRKLVRARVDRNARNAQLLEKLMRLSELHAAHLCGINPKNFPLINDVVVMIDHTRFSVEEHKKLFAVCMNGMHDVEDNAEFLKTIFLKFHKSKLILTLDFDEFKYFARYVSFLGDKEVLQSMFGAYIARQLQTPGFDPAQTIEYGIYLEQETGLLDVWEAKKFTEMRLKYDVSDAIQPLVDFYAFTLNRNATKTEPVRAMLDDILATLLKDYPGRWGYYLQLAAFSSHYNYWALYNQVTAHLLAAFSREPRVLEELTIQELRALSAIAMKQRARAFGDLLVAHIEGARDTDLTIQIAYVELLLQWKFYRMEGEDFTEIYAAIEDLCASRPQPRARFKTLDTHLYNTLVQTAFYACKPLATVEAFSVHLQLEYTLQRDEETFWLLINHALDTKNTTKALEYFENSFTEGVLWMELEGKYTTVVNRLMRQLGEDLLAKGNFAAKDDCNTIWRWFTRLDQIKHKLDVYTAAMWMQLFLKNEKEYVGNAVTIAEHVLPPLPEKGELNEILPKEKADFETYKPLYDVLYDYTLSSTLDANRNWSILGFIDTFFVIPAENYLPLMRKFCEMDRPNAGLILFKNMKRYHRFYGLPPPSEEVYIFLFNKFGEMYYEEGVAQMHKMMNMEVAVHIDARVMNAALAAHVNLQDTLAARTLFHSMLAIPKEVGINEETVSIMMKNYALLSIGSARRFWSSLSDFDILPTADNYKWFIIAHCHAGLPDEALLIAQSMEENYVEVTGDVLATLHNWTSDAAARAEVVAWASALHPQLWARIAHDGLLTSGEESFDRDDPKRNVKLLATRAIE